MIRQHNKPTWNGKVSFVTAYQVMNKEPINPVSKKVELDNNTYIIVNKLPLRKYAALLLALDKLPQELEKFTSVGDAEMFKTLPKLVATCLDEVINILVIATDRSKEDVEQLSLDEVVNILQAIIEVNKYTEVYEKVKKMFARPTANPQA